jgi:surface antigen
MSFFVRLIVATNLSVVAPVLAQAQLAGLYPMSSDGVSLNNADFALLIDTANSLLRRPHIVVGDSATWRSDQTGSHGTISVTKTFHRESMLCHALTYETNPVGAPSANTVHLNWCKTSDGWRILS